MNRIPWLTLKLRFPGPNIRCKVPAVAVAALLHNT